MRYRNSGCATLDYTDRLHYTADWIYENEKRGYLKDVTKEVGGQSLKLDLSFMSTHPDSYKQLKGNPGRIAVMAAKVPARIIIFRRMKSMRMPAKSGMAISSVLSRL